MVATKVTSIKQLNGLLSQNKTDFFINLGGLRRSKYIERTKNGNYYVFHEIDGSDDVFSPTELMDETSIGDAITKGAFYMYG